MTDQTRRQLTSSILAGAGLCALSGMAIRSNAIASDRRTEFLDVLNQIYNVSKMLSTGKVSQLEWQSEISRLVALADYREFKSAIDFDKAAASLRFAEKGVATSRVTLPMAHGMSPTVYTKLFAVGKGRAVIPHGHKGMCSGHLILDGRMRSRQYDRIETGEKSWRVRPVHDAIEGAGDFSTISDDASNVHWFVAEKDSWTLDFIMAPANTGTDWTIQNLDMADAIMVEQDLLDVPTIGVSDALQKYG